MLFHVKSSTHSGLRVALDGARKHKAAAALRIEFHRRRSARLHSNPGKAWGFHQRRIVPYLHRYRAQVFRLELVCELPAVGEHEPHRLARPQREIGRAKSKFSHLNTHSLRRLRTRRERDNKGRREEYRDGPSRSQQGQSRLNGVSSELNSANTPFGLGYQTHTCNVTRGGCQNVNAAPD